MITSGLILLHSHNPLTLHPSHFPMPYNNHNVASWAIPHQRRYAEAFPSQIRPHRRNTSERLFNRRKRNHPLPSVASGIDYSRADVSAAAPPPAVHYKYPPVPLRQLSDNYRDLPPLCAAGFEGQESRESKLLI